MIEVEKRVLLSKDKLSELKNHFEQSGKFVKEFKRFTMIGMDNEDFTSSFDATIDLRVRVSGNESPNKGRLTIKYGDWVNDNGREEYEVDFATDQIISMMNILKLLNRNFYIISYIHRYQYEVDGFDITLDEYHFMDECLLEVELQAKDQAESDEALIKIKKFLSYLDLKEVESEKWTDFVKRMNEIKETQINFKNLKIEDWFEKWKDFIFCKI